MKQLTADEIKKLELDLLIEFHKLCEANHLYYTLCGGTLLGAIRHKGFIPWDDDIDVLMPRPDYERLLENLNITYETLPDYMKVISWKNGASKYPFMKLADTRTEIVVDYFNSEYNINHIWIDIFPIDGNPSDEKELQRLYKKSLVLRKLLTIKMAQKGEGKTKLKRLMKPILIKLLSGMSFDKLCTKIDNLAQTYDFQQSEYIGGVVWGYGPQERIHKKEFLEPVLVEFEGEHFNAPSNYDSYLSGLYKDYMQLPPEKDRVVHGIHAYFKEEGSV